MNIQFTKSFIRMADDGWHQGWHERNGGNLSYRLSKEDIEAAKALFNTKSEWKPLGIDVPGLAGEFFMVTASGGYFRNICDEPEKTTGIIEISESGKEYRSRLGFEGGGRPTSELPAHLMNHEVRKRVSGGKNRVIYHAHPANLIALTFVLPLKDEIFTRELWEMATECPVVFNEGLGVVEWLVPGGETIAAKTSEKMAGYRAVVWAHHGCFCAGTDFDETFGLMHTIEKAAEILVKVRAMGGTKLQTITPCNFRALGQAFDVKLPEKFLYDK